MASDGKAAATAGGKAGDKVVVAGGQAGAGVSVGGGRARGGDNQVPRHTWNANQVLLDAWKEGRMGG